MMTVLVNFIPGNSDRYPLDKKQTMFTNAETVKNYVTAACEYYMEKLLPRGRKSITILINVHPGDLKNNNEGLCTRKSKKDYTIDLLSGFGLSNMLMALAHECVHVKQYAKGEMYDSFVGGYVRWLNKQYDFEKVDEMSHWDLPWEIDARGREEGLFIRFCEHFGIICEEDKMNFESNIDDFLKKKIYLEPGFTYNIPCSGVIETGVPNNV